MGKLVISVFFQLVRKSSPVRQLCVCPTVNSQDVRRMLDWCSEWLFDNVKVWKLHY